MVAETEGPKEAETEKKKNFWKLRMKAKNDGKRSNKDVHRMCCHWMKKNMWSQNEECKWSDSLKNTTEVKLCWNEMRWIQGIWFRAFKKWCSMQMEDAMEKLWSDTQDPLGRHWMSTTVHLQHMLEHVSSKQDQDEKSSLEISIETKKWTNRTSIQPY